GATNHPELLDRALQRRFDVILEFAAPTDEQILSLIKKNLKPLTSSRMRWQAVLDAAQGLSQSEIVRAAEDAVKTALLDERHQLKAADLLDRLNGRKCARPSQGQQNDLLGSWSPGSLSRTLTSVPEPSPAPIKPIRKVGAGGSPCATGKPTADACRPSSPPLLKRQTTCGRSTAGSSPPPAFTSRSSSGAVTSPTMRSSVAAPECALGLPGPKRTKRPPSPSMYRMPPGPSSMRSCVTTSPVH